MAAELSGRWSSVSLCLAIAWLCSASVGCAPDDQAVELHWTISGKQADGSSVDRCDEVGATNVAIKALVGPAQFAQTVPCANSVGDTRTVLSMRPGDWSYAIRLLADQTPLTAELTVDVVVDQRRGFGEVDFVPADFVDGKQLSGNLRFRLTFGGKACGTGQTPTPVVYRVQLKTAQGLATGAKVCATPDCVLADGQTAMACDASSPTLSISDLAWGPYRLTITADSMAEKDCWKLEEDLLVGAGDNPALDLDLALRGDCSQ